MAATPAQLDAWLERVRGCRFLAERDLRALCAHVKELLLEENNVQPVSSPVTIAGDLHGQFYDLLELLRLVGCLTPGERAPASPPCAFVFMGDFVDRGYYSLETLTLLLVLKARWPAHVTLLRGNHESRSVTQAYGFYDECQQKYGNANAWRHCCAVFDCLTIAALVDDSVLCVHGGLSPELRTLDQVRTIERAVEVPTDGAMADLMWSDPEAGVDEWQISPRGCGWLFGARVTAEFCRVNSLELVARAHQLVQEGYCYHFDSAQVATVWSCPNYCYRCGNLASVMQIGLAPRFDDTDAAVDTDGKHSVVRSTPTGGAERLFRIFDAVPDADRVIPAKNTMPYFL